MLEQEVETHLVAIYLATVWYVKCFCFGGMCPRAALRSFRKTFLGSVARAFGVGHHGSGLENLFNKMSALHQNDKPVATDECQQLGSLNNERRIYTGRHVGLSVKSCWSRE